PPLAAPPSEIPQDLPRGSVAGCAGDAATGMGAGSAHIEAGDRPAVIRVAKHGPRGKNLSEIERAVENVAADQAESPFEIERAEDLPPDHRRLEVGRIGIDRVDHQVR